jgi:hypothetical protein
MFRIDAQQSTLASPATFGRILQEFSSLPLADPDPLE